MNFTYNLNENQQNLISGGENAGNLYIPNFTNASKENNNNVIYGGNTNARFQDLAVPSFLYKREFNLNLPKYNHKNHDDISILSDEAFEQLFDMISKKMKHNTTKRTSPRIGQRKTKRTR